MVKIIQYNSLSFIFLFNQLQSTTVECCFVRFLLVLKQNAHIIAIYLITVNKSNDRFTFNLGNSPDFECIVLHFDASTARN